MLPSSRPVRSARFKTYPYSPPSSPTPKKSTKEKVEKSSPSGKKKPVSAEKKNEKQSITPKKHKTSGVPKKEVTKSKEKQVSKKLEAEHKKNLQSVMETEDLNGALSNEVSSDEKSFSSQPNGVGSESEVSFMEISSAAAENVLEDTNTPDLEDTNTPDIEDTNMSDVEEKLSGKEDINEAHGGEEENDKEVEQVQGKEHICTESIEKAEMQNDVLDGSEEMMLTSDAENKTQISETDETQESTTLSEEPASKTETLKSSPVLICDEILSSIGDDSIDKVTQDDENHATSNESVSKIVTQSDETKEFESCKGTLSEQTESMPNPTGQTADVDATIEKLTPHMPATNPKTTIMGTGESSSIKYLNEKETSAPIKVVKSLVTIKNDKQPVTQTCVTVPQVPPLCSVSQPITTSANLPLIFIHTSQGNASGNLSTVVQNNLPKLVSVIQQQQAHNNTQKSVNLMVVNPATTSSSQVMRKQEPMKLVTTSGPSAVSTTTTQANNSILTLKFLNKNEGLAEDSNQLKQADSPQKTIFITDRDSGGFMKLSSRFPSFKIKPPCKVETETKICHKFTSTVINLDTEYAKTESRLGAAVKSPGDESAEKKTEIFETFEGKEVQNDTEKQIITTEKKLIKKTKGPKLHSLLISNRPVNLHQTQEGLLINESVNPNLSEKVAASEKLASVAVVRAKKSMKAKSEPALSIDHRSFESVVKSQQHEIHRLRLDKKKLYEINVAMQAKLKILQQVIENQRRQEQLLLRILEVTQNHGNSDIAPYTDAMNPTFPPVGILIDNEVHLGQGVWLAKREFDRVMNVATTPSLLVRNLGVAVYGEDVLKRSSVLGKPCMRFTNRGSRPPLSPTRFTAIKETFDYWLTKHGYAGQEKLDELAHTTQYLGSKIQDLNRPEHLKNKYRRTKKPRLPTPECVVDTDCQNSEDGLKPVPGVDIQCKLEDVVEEVVISGPTKRSLKRRATRRPGPRSRRQKRFASCNANDFLLEDWDTSSQDTSMVKVEPVSSEEEQPAANTAVSRVANDLSVKAFFESLERDIENSQ